MNKRIRQAMDAVEKVNYYGSLEKRLKSMKADELWEKYSETLSLNPGAESVIYKFDFLAALAERDAYVKKECVRVCREKADWNKGLGYHGHMERVANDCAAAIEKLEIK